MNTMSAAQAVEKLIHEYGKLVFHTIYGLTSDWEESQDLTQDTFHQALKAIDAARDKSGEHFNAKAWLLRIALNTVRMERRRRAIFRFIPFSRMQEGKQSENDAEKTLNEQALPAQPGGYGTGSTDDPAELVAEQDAVRRTMAKLPEALRVCLTLSVIAGLSTTEIAALLDVQEAAVRQRIARARKQFQQAYAYESGEEVVDTLSMASLDDKRRKNSAEQQALIDKPQRFTLAAHPPTTRRSYV